MHEKFPSAQELQEPEKERESEKFKSVEVLRPDKPEERFNIAYEVFDRDESKETSNDAKTVVILSGWGGSLHQLKELAKYLAKEGNKRVVVISNLGTGKSSNIPNVWLRYKHRDHSYEAEVIKEAIRKVVKKENLDAQNDGISLVGYSTGSILAIAVTEKDPKLVKDLILVHPVGFEEISMLELIKRSVITVGNEIILPVKNVCMPLIDKSYKTKSRDPKLSARQLQDMLDNFSCCTRLAQRLLSDWWPATHGYLKRELENIKSNILVITGGNDPFLDDQEAKGLRRICKLSPTVSCEHIEDSTHSAPIFYYKDYGAKIKDFLIEE